ncbi:hypothetical protein [Micromonospora sp. NPDC049679]|uniref:hypothetical protein n=1 Tax=Micromonospora sp. NPDC049679 TaxID=3155920 RepID=UPI0033ED16A7
MPKPLTLLLAGVVGAVLAVLGVAAVAPLLTVSLQNAANTQTAEQPEVYGNR